MVAHSGIASLADALAVAVQHRHDLDELAERGGSVPAALLYAADGEIRAAELAVVRCQNALR